MRSAATARVSLACASSRKAAASPLPSPGQADAAGVEAAERHSRPPRLDAAAGHRSPGVRRLGRHVRLRAAAPPRARPGAALTNEALLAAAKARAGLRSARHRAAAGRRRAPPPFSRAAVAAGFPGAMIGTLPRGIGSVLDAADLDAFWAAADDLGAAIHIHPSFDAGDDRTYDLRPAECGRPHHRRHGRGGAADLQAATSRATRTSSSSRRWAAPACRFWSAACSGISS